MYFCNIVISEPPHYMFVQVLELNPTRLCCPNKSCY